MGDKSMMTSHPLSRISLRKFLLAVSLIVVFAFPLFTPAGTETKAAFEKLKSLAGDWEGKDDMGMAAKTNFKVMISGTTVMETLSPTGMGGEEMLSLFNIDGDSISLLHYCPTNNQPRMRAAPPSGDIKELTFTFQGAGNLPSEDVGHQHKLVLHFDDADHITETWTWRSKGKDTLMVIHFARKKR
jgi:hypothetical protein